MVAHISRTRKQGSPTANPYAVNVRFRSTVTLPSAKVCCVCAPNGSPMGWQCGTHAMWWHPAQSKGQVNARATAKQRQWL